ncbi:MAG: 1,4-alpha-glucan branching enzyme, partial [Planctomycetota bacterium]
DGTHLYEHEDPRLGFHPDWKSLIFNYSRHEVRSFLISSACFWLDKFHADGIRVDAVASMLYRDYSRKDGEWIPNGGGGRENDEAIEFLKQLNTEVYRSFPGVQMFAEESTAWPHVSKPVYDGGLGFGFKWDMGWMHDTLKYLAHEPVHRKWHHNEITFRSVYMFSEHYTLPLSHDEVVHGKGSLIAKMPGDQWQRRANLRLLLLNQWTQPGKKLLFMGGELGQTSEWNEEFEISWELLAGASEGHLGIQRLVDRLNELYRTEQALHELDSFEQGHQWVEADDNERSVTAFLRKGRGGRENLLCVLNYEAEVWSDVPFGVPFEGEWEVLLNTDASEFGGSGAGTIGRVAAQAAGLQGQPCSITVDVPPLGGLVLKPM